MTWPAVIAVLIGAAALALILTHHKNGATPTAQNTPQDGDPS